MHMYNEKQQGVSSSLFCSSLIYVNSFQSNAKKHKHKYEKKRKKKY